MTGTLQIDMTAIDAAQHLCRTVVSRAAIEDFGPAAVAVAVIC